MMLFLIAWLGLGTSAWAEAPASSMDLAGAYSAAIERSEALAGQLELVNQAEERAKQALAGVLPTVGFAASRLWQEDPATSAGSLFPPIQDNVRLTANQPLFRGLRSAGVMSTFQRRAPAHSA
jgi:outer membrane protein TolC